MGVQLGREVLVRGSYERHHRTQGVREIHKVVIDPFSRTHAGQHICSCILTVSSKCTHSLPTSPSLPSPLSLFPSPLPPPSPPLHLQVFVGATETTSLDSTACVIYTTSHVIIIILIKKTISSVDTLSFCIIVAIYPCNVYALNLIDNVIYCWNLQLLHCHVIILIIIIIIVHAAFIPVRAVSVKMCEDVPFIPVRAVSVKM